MGFAGINAIARARLANDVVQERLRRRGLTYDEMRVDYIGLNSLHGNDAMQCPEPYEVRLRIAARTPDRKAADGDVGVGLEFRHPGEPLLVPRSTGHRSPSLPTNLVACSGVNSK